MASVSMLSAVASARSGVEGPRLAGDVALKGTRTRAERRSASARKTSPLATPFRGQALRAASRQAVKAAAAIDVAAARSSLAAEKPAEERKYEVRRRHPPLASPSLRRLL